MNRLLSHNQMVICGKSSCNHCEKIFDFKNKFHNHIRNHECAATFFFVAKSISFHKFNLSTLASVESIAFEITITFIFLSSISLSIYRFVLFSSFIYELYKKLYFMIVDLYIRYALLSRSLSNKITRIITVFSVIFM